MTEATTIVTTGKTMSIEVDYELADPPDRVWLALTDAKLLSEWLMENDIRPVVGHRFQFKGKPIPGVWDGRTECEVLAVEPLRSIRYTWRGGANGTPGHRLDTVVTWTLTPKEDGGTRLHLSHGGFTEANRFAFDMMSKGWRGAADGIGRALKR